jgi:hypothetical protein
MSEVKEQSIASAAKRLMQATGAEAKPIYAKLAEVNAHYLHRIQAEWQEAFHVFWKINGAVLPADKLRLYQDWLTDFSHRRTEDASYAMEVARDLSNTEMKLSMGLIEKEDQQAAKVA